MNADIPQIFKKRFRAYFLRVSMLLGATFVGAFVLGGILRLTPLAPMAGGLIGVLAMVSAVGGSYYIHWRTVRCPACDRWVMPVGINGFAPSACPACKVALR